MKIKKHKKSEKGFVIVLAILILLVMSLMGTTLVVIASNDHKGNTLRDYNQQTFYAAETGIQEAKEYLNQQVQKGVKFKPCSGCVYETKLSPTCTTSSKNFIAS